MPNAGALATCETSCKAVPPEKGPSWRQSEVPNPTVCQRRDGRLVALGERRGTATPELGDRVSYAAASRLQRRGQVDDIESEIGDWVGAVGVLVVHGMGMHGIGDTFGDGGIPCLIGWPGSSNAEDSATRKARSSPPSTSRGREWRRMGNRKRSSGNTTPPPERTVQSVFGRHGGRIPFLPPNMSPRCGGA